MTYRNREHLAALADRCDAAAEQLAYEGEHAAEVLPTRANGNVADPQQWAADKQAAAAAAREFAQELRAEAAELAEGARPSNDRIRQAELVATAAEAGGILIDGSRLAADALQNSMATEAERQAVREANRERVETIEDSGQFHHTAEPGQVPYYRLGDQATSSDAPTSAADDAADDADGM